MTTYDDHTGTNNFINCNKHNLIIKKLADVSDDEPLEVLELYYELLKLREQAFPLLLSNGEQYLLERAPTHLYLLPEFKPLGKYVSWVLVQYPSVRNQRPAVEILQWRFPPDRCAEISPLGASYSVPRSQYIYEDFAQRAVSIDWTIDEEAFYITLQFKHGRLKINADSELGIEAVNWSERKPKYQNRRLERASFKGKPKMLWVEENNETHNWYYNNVYDKAQKSITLPQNIGKIYGVDAAQNTPQRIYFGDETTCVNCIDLDSPDKPLLTSTPLGGGIYDILVIPDPSQKNQQTILVATNNGYIFCLEDRDNKLSIRYYQAIGEHFKQLLGFGSDNIVMVDHYNNLIPIKLGNPKQFLKLQSDLTNSLFENDCITECLKAPLDKYLSNNGKVKKARHLLCLAIEHYFLHYDKKIYDTQFLDNWCRWLNEKKTAPDVNYWFWLELHLQVLERMETGLRRACYQAGLLKWKKTYITDVSRLEPLLTMYCPESVDEKNIPDEVWSKILKGSDLIGAFLRINDLHKKPNFQKQWQKSAERIARVRNYYSQQTFAQRPLSILHSIRVNFAYTTVQLIMTDSNNYYLVAIDSQADLFLLTVPKEGPSSCSPSERLQLKGWQGRPITLLAGEALYGILGKGNQHWVFVASSQGEVSLFEWLTPHKKLEKGKLELRYNSNNGYPMLIRSALTISLDLEVANKVIILVGRDYEHYSSIVYLRFFRLKRGNDISADFKRVWKDKEQGELREPVLSITDNKLWAINQRRRSAVLCWDIQFKRGGLELLEQFPPILLSDQPLYCLKLGGEGEQETIICGGHDGLVYALSTIDGSLRWMLNCGKSLRRLSYLPLPKENEDAPGLWLLGSDHPNLVLVNSRGQFRAIYEKSGPTTALLDLPEQRLLLCNAQGRLMLMSAVRKKSVCGEFTPSTSNPKLLAGFYPRRSKKTIKPNVLCEVLQEQLKSKVVDRDFLVMQRWLQSALHCIKNQSDWLQSQQDCFNLYLVKQPVQRIGLFLSDLRHLERGQDCPDSIELLQTIWDSLPARQPYDVLIPQLIHHLLRTLDKQSPANTSALAESLALFKTIDLFLWQEQNKLTNQEGRNSLRLRLSHLRDLRLSQVVYFWQKTVEEPHISCRLDQWCELLRQAWAITDEKLLKRRLRWVLIDEGLPLLSGKDRAWQFWLADIFSEPEDEPMRVEKEIPEELLPLLKNHYSPWRKNQKETLMRLWKTEREDFWQEWVGKLAELLSNLQVARDQPKRILWQESRLINQIRGLFRDQGTLWFSSNNGFHLLALCWPTIVEAWDKEGKKHLESLLQETTNDSSRYVTLSQAKIHWHTSNRAEVSLFLINRHLEGLRPEKKLNSKGFEIKDTQMPERFDARTEKTTLTIEVETQKEGLLEGYLYLKLYSPHHGNSFECECELQGFRSVEAFNDSLGFPETWETLQRILTQREETSQKVFLWWDGDYWSNEERKRLKVLIEENFHINVDLQKISLDVIENPLKKTIFSPDIALGKISGGALLEQVHGLLYSLEPDELNQAALSAWIIYRDDDIPPKVENALAQWLYPRARLDEVLLAVLREEHFSLFKQALNSLDSYVMGAWCYGQPLYTENIEEVSDFSLEELYIAVESLFGLEIWQALQKQNVTSEDLKKWLKIDQKRANKLLKVGGALNQILRKDSDKLQVVAEQLTDILQGSLSISITSQRIYFVELSEEMKISVLHGSRFSRCYLFFTFGLTLTEITEIIAQQNIEGLWLCVTSDNHFSTELPGDILKLTTQQLCRILFAKGGQQARNVLNQLAGQQMRYNPGRVFRTSGGQSVEQTERHFEGRDRELECLHTMIPQADGRETEQHRLHAMLAQEDENKLSARLIIGTRRLGKTSLWDRFRYEVKFKNPDRTIIYLDLHDFFINEKWSAVNVEREFVARFLMAAKLGEIKDYWPVGLRDDLQKCIEVRRVLKAGLDKRPLKPVLILDETRYWAEVDYKLNYRMSKLLRSLVDGGSCVLIATSYPFHSNQLWGLNLMKYQANTGMYNFFQDDIELLPWPKSIAWRYLQQKLAGFGIVLPYKYRAEMLSLTRGIPWIAHKLGALLCAQKDSYGQAQRRVVLRSEWQEAYRQTLAEINAEMKGTVRAVVERVLRKNDLILHWEEAEKIGYKVFLDGLISLVKPPPQVNLTNDRWESDQSFDIETLAKYLSAFPETILCEVLNELTATPVLCAHSDHTENFEQLYSFANNLFPSCLHLSKKSNMALAEGREK